MKALIFILFLAFSTAIYSQNQVIVDSVTVYHPVTHEKLTVVKNRIQLKSQLDKLSKKLNLKQFCADLHGKNGEIKHIILVQEKKKKPLQIKDNVI